MSVPNLERRDGHRRQLDDLHLLYVRATRTDIDGSSPKDWFTLEALSRLGIEPAYSVPMWHHFAEMIPTAETLGMELKALDMIHLARKAARMPDSANWLLHTYQEHFGVEPRAALIMMERAVMIALDVEDLVLFNRNAQGGVRLQ